MSKVIDLLGQTFGNLKVIERVGSDNSGRSVWMYQCKCGALKTARGKDLRQGKITSCGCMKGKSNITHGLSNTRIYQTWLGIRKRCGNPNAYEYENYGGRGIVVCDEWKNNFISFYKWATENGYKENLTIDRVNNDGNYEPTNCRWADRITQQNNTRSNHPITINGKTHNINQWCRIAGLPRTTVKSRLRYGWTGEKLLQPRRGITVEDVEPKFDIK